MQTLPGALSAAALCCALAAACGEPTPCGPDSAVVRRVIDGDTVELASGEHVRYLLVDTPEVSNAHDECYGAEAREFNRRLVEGQRVTLRYDVQCRDRYARTLAYVSLGARDVSELLVEQGYACVLYIPPNGAERAREFERLEAQARIELRGLWGACASKPCG